MSKLFNTTDLFSTTENMDHQMLFNAIEDVVLFDPELTGEFLNGDLHPLMRDEILYGILEFARGSAEEIQFKAIFDKTMDKIIQFHEEMENELYSPDFGEDHEGAAEYSKALDQYIAKSIQRCLKCYIDDLVIVGLSVQYVSLKNSEPAFTI